MGSSAVDEASALRQRGPGRITMLPTTSIEFSAALTRAREGLDEAGMAWVKSQLAEIEAVLQGIEGATSTALPPPITSESRLKTLLRVVIAPWWSLVSGGETTAASEHNRMVAESGVGALPTPPPRGLIRAAEGRLLAQAAAGRIDKETASTLILPWQSATVTR